jgi:hypothetical protein
VAASLSIKTGGLVTMKNKDMRHDHIDVDGRDQFALG